MDVDGYNVAVPVRTPLNFGYFSYNGGTVDISQMSEELRIASPSNQLFEYTAGLLYYRLDLDRAFQRRTGGCASDTTVSFGAPCPNPAFNWVCGQPRRS